MKKFLIMLMLSLLALTLNFQFNTTSAYSESAETEDSVIFEGDYYSVHSAWLNEEFTNNSNFYKVVQPNDFDNSTNLVSNNDYEHDVYQWDNEEVITFDITVPSTGLYQIALDFYSLSYDYDDIELAIEVNQELQYIECSQIILYKLWVQADEFPIDRYGNDFYSEQGQDFSWINQNFYDPMGLFNEPLTFKLNAGSNQISLSRTKGDILLGDIYVTGYEDVIDYVDYSENATYVSDEINIQVEAEIPTYKNSSSIQPGVSRDALVTPFDVNLLKLNILSGTTFNSEREEVSYEISVPETGYYSLTFKVIQNEITNGVSYRTIKINGEVPFTEAKHLEFVYDTNWQNVTLGNDEEPYLFYLEEGINTISLAVDLSLYQDCYYQIEEINSYINELALQVQKLTGNQVDEDRDWDIITYLPGVEEALINVSFELSAIYDYLIEINPSSKLTEAQSSLKIAIRNVDYLLEDINEIPKNISLLTTSNESISSTLSNVTDQLLDSPLSIDKLYLHTDTKIERAEASWFTNFWLGIKRFFLSFFDEKYNEETSDTELIVWANRSKQYVDLMQKMADENFTNETGIEVNISIMAAESKLILSNSAGTNPDVALGVASWLPYDLGIRGAILDLTEFKDDPEFTMVLDYYIAESLIPLAYNNGLYGLPDTENFYVLYYREDILSALDIDVPQTWEEVTEIMPVLKRYGLNFYIPLSSATSLKSFDSTLPFFFQNGSGIYDQSGFYVDLENEESVNALETMTELYTIYSMDTTVTSFYNDFKLGLSPIGVGDFGMYVTLLNAATNIKGLWNIALLPGVEQTDGSIDRSAPGAQTANMIFENTEKKDESWEFLKWWSETSTQTQFSDLLLSTLGSEYLWNSANVEAFQALNINEDHQDVILEQWSYLKELPKVPGSYQVELEISNIWNSVVIDRESLRVLLNDAIITMDKEIHKKMSEFGYMDQDANILKPYILPTISLIQQWKRGEFDE